MAGHMPADPAIPEPNCAGAGKRNGSPKGAVRLLAKTKLRDEIGVALVIFPLEKIEQ